jgi:hypothetical protein
MKIQSTAIKLFLASVTVCFFIGCSIDSTDIIEHPISALPGAQFSVSVADMYVLLSNSKLLTQAVQRDSLHMAAGLPAGWSVQSIKFYAATGFKLTKYMGTGFDTTELLKLFMDSLAVYKTRAVAMATDAGAPAYLRANTFDADDTAGNTITINGDSVAQWLAYKGLINFNFPVGTVMDTAMPSTDTTLGIDTIGMKLIPIFIFATIKASTVLGVTNLFYYTKTGPVGTDSLDPGSMAYATIFISSSHVERGLGANQASGYLEVVSNPFISGNLIYFKTAAANQSKLSIYSTGGQLVQTIPASSNTILWDKTNSSGMRVVPGSYIVKLEDANGISTAKQFRIIR